MVENSTQVSVTSALKLQAGEELLPEDDKGMIIPSDTDFLDTWEVS